MLKPLTEIQNENIEQKLELYTKLEKSMELLRTRAGTFQQNLENDTQIRMQMASEYERQKRAQMVEARAVADAIPSGYFSGELEKQIEDQKQQIQQKASAGGFLKTLFVWVVLFLILGFVYFLWKNLDETEKKFKY